MHRRFPFYQSSPIGKNAEEYFSLSLSLSVHTLKKETVHSAAS
jgi:hypothetical protein